MLSDSYYPFEFETEVVTHMVGTYHYTVIFLPRHLHGTLPLKEHPRLRIEAEINGIPAEGAWQPVRGDWYLMLSKRLLKDAELQLGDYAEVRFRVIDQNSVTVPTELKVAIYADSKLASAWEALSAGKKRGYCHRVLSAKREPTKQRRIDEVLVALRELML